MELANRLCCLEKLFHKLISLGVLSFCKADAEAEANVLRGGDIFAILYQEDVIGYRIERRVPIVIQFL